MVFFMKYTSMHVPFRKLRIWQKARELVKEVYLLSHMLPSGEKYGLVSQIQRAAVSVPSNIAEGSRRKSGKDFAHFLDIASGSLAELETQIILGVDVGYFSEVRCQNVLDRIDEIQKMLYMFEKHLTK